MFPTAKSSVSLKFRADTTLGVFASPLVQSNETDTNCVDWRAFCSQLSLADYN
jgi:hypothetical protein